MAGQKANDFDVLLGQRLRAARAGTRVTQTQMGASIGVSPAQYQKYERGINRISAGDLVVFARMLGVPVADLLATPDVVIVAEEGIADEEGLAA